MSAPESVEEFDAQRREVLARRRAERAASDRPGEARPAKCPGCNRKLPKSTGRPRKYCSDACRKKAGRSATATPKVSAFGDHKTAGQAPDSATKTARRLGTTAKTTDMQASGLSGTKRDESDQEPERYSGGAPGTAMESDGGTAARDGRFELRESLRAVSGLDRLLKCGISVLAGGVTPVIRNGRAGYAGVVTCGSVHVCPCCSTSIRRVRQDELDQVGRFWECQSCGLVMMTLTMRHYERQALAALAEQQRTAWRVGFGQNAGRTWRDAKRAYGVRGSVRAWEVTHGRNGWHCHYHVLLFLARPLKSGQVESLQALAFQVWSAALDKAGAYLPVEKSADGKPVGVKIDAPDRGESGQLARYLMKNQDGKAAWGVAAELTRQDVKQGQGDHRTPFEIGRAAVKPDADPRDIALWREFEQTATGVRSLYWSNGLRKLLAEMGFELDARNDGAVAAEEEAAGERVALIPAATWYQHIARHKGRALALLKAAEQGGVSGVRALVESWGLIWGADIFEAEDAEGDTRLLTAAEVMRRNERAELVARADVWRRAFAVAEMAEGAKEFAKKPDAPEYKRRAAAVKRAEEKRAEAAQEAEEVLTEGIFPASAVPDVRAEFLRRRRIANAAHAEDRAAALARFREWESESAVVR